METYLYTCQHCFKEFVPTRRRVHKFCSDSCRVSHHQCNKRLQLAAPDSLTGSKELKPKKKKGKKKEKENKESMSLSGIGNAAAGTLIVDKLTSMLTPEQNKLATKGDIVKLANYLTRYQKINNIKPNAIGQNPFLDKETGLVVYRFGQ